MAPTGRTPCEDRRALESRSTLDDSRPGPSSSRSRPCTTSGVMLVTGVVTRVLTVTTFKDEAEALSIANDTLYGLGAGVWSRDANTCYRMGRGIQAGRVWVNNYHSYPAHAAFGGYKNSGIGRETHKMMLNHYQQTKNVLVSYAEEPDGFF